MYFFHVAMKLLGGAIVGVLAHSVTNKRSLPEWLRRLCIQAAPAFDAALIQRYQ
jgi:hypothetical protein